MNKPVIKICPICGQSFKTTKPRQKKYCSPACQSKRDRERTKYAYQCTNCGKTFFDRYRARRQDRIEQFCSHECANEWRAKQLRSKYKAHVCNYCGETFYRPPRDTNPNLYCSNHCQRMALSKYKNPKTEQIVADCLIGLGVEFERQYEYDKTHYADFYIKSSGLLLELDGKRWHGSPDARMKDMSKMLNASAYGFSMLRLWCSRAQDAVKICHLLKGVENFNDACSIVKVFPSEMINSVNLIDEGVESRFRLTVEPTSW